MSLTHTAEEAADLLGVSYDWLTREARKGKVPHRRFGRLVKFTDEDVAQIISDRATGGPAVTASGVSPRSAARLARSA